MQECKNEKRIYQFQCFSFSWEIIPPGILLFPPHLSPTPALRDVSSRPCARLGEQWPTPRRRESQPGKNGSTFEAKFCDTDIQKICWKLPQKKLSRCLIFYMTPFEFDSNVDVTFTFWFFASELEEIKALKDAPEQWHSLQQQCPAKYVPRHCKCLWKCKSTGNQVEKCCMSANRNQSNSDPNSKAITRWHFVHRSHTRNLCRPRTVMVGAHEDGRNVTGRFCQFCQAK